jgi:hypothetical protein
MGLKVEVVTKYDREQFGLQFPSDFPVSLAASLAGQRLAGESPVFEFLPPKVSSFKKFMDRYSSGTTEKVALAVIAVLLLAGGAFGYQQWQLTRLKAEWAQVSQKSNGLKDIRGNIRKYRPWFDESARTLSILRQLTEAFPDRGSVSAKTVEIRDKDIVSCSGIFTDNQQLLNTTERLRKSPNVSDFTMGPTRGTKAPMQFSFEFRWIGGAK